MGSFALSGPAPAFTALLGGLLILACGPLEPGAARPVRVRRVLDGDTLELSAPPDARSPDEGPLDAARVRLLGVDTPEVAEGDRPGECFSAEAEADTRAQLEGQLVTLEYEPENRLRDVFGRLLAYVAREGEVHNERLIRAGFAVVYRRSPFRERSRYLDLEARARDAGAGLWSACR